MIEFINKPRFSIIHAVAFIALMIAVRHALGI